MEIHFYVVIFIIFLLIIINEGNDDQQISAFLNGDFIIGALLPIHHQPSLINKISGHIIKCGSIRENYGIQRVETAFQTIDKINSDPNLLPNITLGIEIRDECWYAPVALQQSIELIRDAVKPHPGTSTNVCYINQTEMKSKFTEQRGPLIGVIGPGSSSVALQVQNLLQLFHIPQVGYSATSKDLSDKSRFNYFLRVVPSDFYQAQVILDIVRNYGWTYVSAVNTNENYGQSGIQAFRELAEQTEVCIAREFSVLSNDKEEIFEKAIKTLDQDKQAVVVVCFCEGFTVRGLLEATKRLNMTNRFLFIGSDGWADRSDVTEGNEEIAWGSISIRIHSPIVKDFKNYYLKLNPHKNLRNPWFKEMWEDFFHCSLNKQIGNDKLKEKCTGKERFPKNHRQDAKLSFVVKAIYSLAHGLHNMQKDLCQGALGVCPKLQSFNGSLFKSYLMNVSFEYENDTVQFDENGDPPGKYVILNYQRKMNDTYDYVEIGNWHNGTLMWHKEIQFGNRTEVSSVCSMPCKVGHYKNVQQSGKEKKCCWACSRCGNDEVVHPYDNTRCEKCLNGSAPNTNQTDCIKLPIVYTKWSDAEAIIAMTFSIIGLITTISSFVVFLKHNDTPVVKSSTRELSYIILIGMGLAYASVYSILAKPSMISCALERTLPGLSFAMIYAALLTKTNRIARILAGSKKKFPSSRKRMFMSTTSQVVITCILIGIEIVVSTWMLFYELPDSQFSYEKTKTVLECNTSPKGVLVPLIYDFLLIFFCTLYALKTRNVPENFNEAKFIGFAMYTTCVIWVAFVPIYFGSNSKVITFSMCVTLSAMVTWAFLFVPKLYIIILRPERNNRSFFTTSKTIRCHIGSRVASALSEKSSISNSWRDEHSTTTFKENSNDEGPDKRTLSCQTEVELLQVLLNPKMLLESYGNRTQRLTPRITERNCCQTENCELKNITITLPDQAL
ncbi:metabotropic glutamate receptor 5-like [Onthophagus taurus]|uniref:metabotropic glutamate receptor 5-like n=1 Tax=Onthophagus taurus TaxID=166361 RepID=UPI000C20969D|nr:metabotropic glutamate receptor 5-like [Onthophagus taurus]XP_022903795.1 metabotropic glutamate receptor 5-like [Onthophagus taurus]